MRHIIEFAVFGSKGKEEVLALTNDGRLYTTRSAGKSLEWAALPAIPQEGFDPANTMAASNGKARAAETVGPIMDVLGKLQQMMPGFGAPIDPSCPVHGEGFKQCGVEGCLNPAALAEVDGKNPRCIEHAIEEGQPLPGSEEAKTNV